MPLRLQPMGFGSLAIKKDYATKLARESLEARSYVLSEHMKLAC